MNLWSFNMQIVIRWISIEQSRYKVETCNLLPEQAKEE